MSRMALVEITVDTTNATARTASTSNITADQLSQGAVVTFTAGTLGELRTINVTLPTKAALFEKLASGKSVLLHVVTGAHATTTNKLGEVKITWTDTDYDDSISQQAIKDASLTASSHRTFLIGRQGSKLYIHCITGNTGTFTGLA